MAEVGRPRVADKRTPYSVPLNNAERELVKRAAEADGFKTTTEWVRDVIVEEARKTLGE